MRHILTAIVFALFTAVLFMFPELIEGEGDNPLMLIVGAPFVLMLYAAMNFGVYECANCKKKSDKHEVLDTKSWKQYKHTTKNGGADMRYKDNPLLTYSQTKFKCEKCGESFSVRERS